MPAPWGPAAALGSVVVIVTRVSAHMHVEVADLHRALLQGGPRVGGSPPPWVQSDEAQLGMWGGKQLCVSLL